MLDEFGNLGRLQEIVKALNMVRSARVQLMFFLQNIGQLHRPLQGRAWQLLFRARARRSPSKPALWIPKRRNISPRRSAIRKCKSRPKRKAAGSLKPEAIPLIRAEDISRLEAGTTINLIEPCPWPIKAIVPVYAKTKFNEGLDPNPTYFG